MDERTRFIIEVYDPAQNWGDSEDEEQNWSVIDSKFYVTFFGAESDRQRLTGTYRSVRIRKIDTSTVATYQDGLKTSG